VEPPLVSAPDEPAKRRPEEPGGLTIPNQDKMVFDLLEHPSPTDFTSSQPLSADNGAEPAETSASAVAEASPTGAPAAPAAALVAATAAQAKPVEEVAVAPPASVKPVAETPAAKKPVEAPAPKMAEKKVEAPKAAVAAKGGWGVQLAAVGSKADADKAVAKFGTLSALHGLSPHVAAATVNGKSVYRVQFAGVADRAAAAGVCARMPAKQACLPVEVK
jgi:cell division septation protein DedD